MPPADGYGNLKRQHSRGRIVEDLNRIAKHCASLPVLDDRSPEEILYDEHGLPK